MTCDVKTDEILEFLKKQDPILYQIDIKYRTGYEKVEIKNYALYAETKESISNIIEKGLADIENHNYKATMENHFSVDKITIQPVFKKYDLSVASKKDNLNDETYCRISIIQ